MGFLSDIVGSITGSGGRDAARGAAKSQERMADKAIEFQTESRDIARSDLQPFRQAGEDQLNNLTELLDRPRKGANIDAVFNDAYGAASDQITARNAAGGKLGSGNTLSDLFREHAVLGEGLRSDRIRLNEGIRQNKINNRFNLVNLGQSSAAGQANTSMQAGNAVSDLYTQRGNATAAGQIGAQNATDAGTGNLINLAAMAFSDRRLKRNLERVGQYKGTPVYNFQYLWSDDWYTGVMAQDVPHAAVQVGDFLAVDYGAL